MTLRVLQVIGAMDRGGAETMLMNLHRAADRGAVQFDYLVHEERVCDYDEEIASLGGRIFRVPRWTGTNTRTYRRLVRAVFAEHPEHPVVHGHIGSSSAIYLAEAKRDGRATIAHSHAQSFLRGPAGLAFKVATRPTRRIADFFLACSREAGIDRFGERVVAGPRFAVLRNGIDTAHYRCDAARHARARRELGFGPPVAEGGVPVIGHVGRLAPEKNHAFLLDAFAAALRALPDARLVLVGRGPLEADLRADVAARGMRERVRFAGLVGNVPDYLAAFDVFALPSPREGLSLAAVEAQAAGLPALLSTGVPDLAVVSRRAERMPLSAGAEAWGARLAELCRASGARPRTDCVDEARAAGFDIADTAAELARIYARLADRAASGRAGASGR